MTLRRKLIIAFAIVLVLVGIQSAVTVLVLERVMVGSALLIPAALSRVDVLAHTESELLRLRTLEYSYLWSAGTLAASRLGEEMVAAREKVDGGLQRYGVLDLDQVRAEALAEILGSYRQYIASQKRVAEALQQGDESGALWEYLRFQPSFQSLDNRLHALRHQEYAATEILRGQMVQMAIVARWPLGITVVLVALAEVGLGWYLSQSIARSLASLHEGARRIAKEDFCEPVPAPPEGDLAALANTLNAVMVTLATHKAERARLEEERLRLLRGRLSRVVRAQEKERARVSRELHDQAGQALVGLQYGLARVQRLPLDPAVAAEIGRLATVAADATRQIRALAHDLRPAVLDDLGLIPALRSYVREFSERIAVPIELSPIGPVPRLAPEAETTVFRVVQEALTNVAKHARAEHVWVELAIDDDELRVQVRDDGCGFDAASFGQGFPQQEGQRPGLGLAGIQERVQLLGGRCTITSEEGQGTQLLAAFPLSPAILGPTVVLKEGVRS